MQEQVLEEVLEPVQESGAGAGACTASCRQLHTTNCLDTIMSR